MVPHGIIGLCCMDHSSTHLEFFSLNIYKHMHFHPRSSEYPPPHSPLSCYQKKASLFAGYSCEKGNNLYTRRPFILLTQAMVSFFMGKYFEMRTTQ